MSHNRVSPDPSQPGVVLDRENTLELIDSDTSPQRRQTQPQSTLNTWVEGDPASQAEQTTSEDQRLVPSPTDRQESPPPDSPRSSDQLIEQQQPSEAFADSELPPTPPPPHPELRQRTSQSHYSPEPSPIPSPASDEVPRTPFPYKPARERRTPSPPPRTPSPAWMPEGSAPEEKSQPPVRLATRATGYDGVSGGHYDSSTSGYQATSGYQGASLPANMTEPGYSGHTGRSDLKENEVIGGEQLCFY